MNIRKNRFFFYVILLPAIVSCGLGSNHPGQQSTTTGVVYVLNQGTFGQGNASVTGYDPVSKVATQNVYSSTNKKPIGDTVEGATLIDGKLYIVVNGSNKIEVVDPTNMQQLGTINFQGSGSPWQIVGAGSNKAYVTEFYNKAVAVVNLTTMQVTGTIPVGTYPEGITSGGGNAYVAVSGLGNGDSLGVLDMTTDKVTDYIKVGDNPTVVDADDQGRVWVVCTGNYGYDLHGNYDASLETFGTVYVINVQNNSIVKKIDIGGHPGGLALLDKEFEAFINNDGVQVIDMQKLTLNSTKILGRNFYAIDVDPNGNTPVLYGSIVTDYTSAAHVILYDLSSSRPAAADSFEAGINPGSFSFIPK